MEKKISGQYFYVNMYVFISDDCNVALTYQGQLFTHANAWETLSDKKCEPFSLSAWSRLLHHCCSCGLSSHALLASCCCFQGWSTEIPALFHFLAEDVLGAAKQWQQCGGGSSPGSHQGSEGQTPPPHGMPRWGWRWALQAEPAPAKAGDRLPRCYPHYVLQAAWGFFPVINHSELISFSHVPSKCLE